MNKYTHSVLITHRNRHQQLRLCIWSLVEAAKASGHWNWELVIVDNGSDYGLKQLAWMPQRMRVIEDLRPMPIFNKPALWNVAIEAARGEVLTFLDADAILGPRFLEGAELLRDPDLVRLCYRVMYLEQDWLERLGPERGRLELVRDLFARYYSGDFRRAYEAYGGHNNNEWAAGGAVWGNSQFSITRENLRDCRPDERFAGRGFEDLDFLRQIERSWGDRYRGRLVEDADRNMFHLEHERTADWHQPELVARNLQLYREG